jgi:outer membrane biosynthesis protein TonB
MTDTIVISFALKSLRDAGFEGGSYNYSVMMEEADTTRTDLVPNDDKWITHTFSAPATQVPPTAAPSAEPTTSARPKPTVEPTPEPTVAPTPEPATPQPDAQSFAAPQERTEDDATSTPLRVAAAGSVVAGAGIALVRFWPF